MKNRVIFKIVIFCVFTFPILLFSDNFVKVTSIEKQPPFFAVITYEIHRDDKPLTTIRVHDDDGLATIAALEMMWTGKTPAKNEGKIPSWDEYRSILDPAIAKAFLTLRTELKENQGDPKYEESIQKSIDELSEIKKKLFADPTFANADPFRLWLNVQIKGLPGTKTKINPTYTFTKIIGDKKEELKSPLSDFHIGKVGSRYANGHDDFVGHDIGKISDGWLESLYQHQPTKHKPKK